MLKKIFDFVERRWLPLCLAGLVLWLLSSNIRACVDELGYQGTIKTKNKEITALKRDREAEAKKAQDALARALTAEAEARKERAEKEKHKADAARREEEKKELLAKIAAMPPTQIVVHTVRILQVDPKEVTLESRGVLFTLVAARRNLEILGEFSLVKKQYSDIQLALARSEASDRKTQKANIELKKAVSSQKTELAGWVKTEIKWNEKFDRQEGERKKARKKGRKEGGIAGAIFGIVLMLFLKK